MKKLLFKGILLGVVMFGAVIYMNYLRTGTAPDLKGATGQLVDSASSSVNQSVNSVRGMVNQLSAQLSSTVASVSSDSTSEQPSKAASGKIYRWVDADGVVHFGDEPPEHAQQLSEMTHIDPDANVVKLPDPEWSNPATPEPVEQPKAELPSNPYHPDTIRELMDQAKATRDLMEQRNQQQQDILESL